MYIYKVSKANSKEYSKQKICLFDITISKVTERPSNTRSKEHYLDFILLCFICKYSFWNILFHYGLSQQMKYSSLCCTVGLCYLSLLNVIVCIYLPWTPSPFLSFPSLLWWQPFCCLCLWVCFCFIDSSICAIF